MWSIVNVEHLLARQGDEHMSSVEVKEKIELDEKRLAACTFLS
jgi:hypothetical protein